MIQKQHHKKGSRFMKLPLKLFSLLEGLSNKKNKHSLSVINNIVDLCQNYSLITIKRDFKRDFWSQMVVDKL